MKNTHLLVIAAILYLNYKMFNRHLTSIFWSLIYSTLIKRISSSKLRFIPLVHLLLVFPILSLLFFSSVLLYNVGMEVNDYLLEIGPLARENTTLNKYLQSAIDSAVEKSAALLKIGGREKLTEGMVYLKIMRTVQGKTAEIMGSTESLIEFVFHFLFFTGITSYFLSLKESPIFYIARSFGRKGQELQESFESIVSSLFLLSTFNFVSVLSVSYFFGSPLYVTDALLSSIFSLFPIVPSFLASVPSSLLFYLRGETVRAVLFLCFSLFLMGVKTRFYKFDVLADSVKAVSVALGYKTFGLPGVILGPFLTSSLLILWPSHAPAASTQKQNQFMGSRKAE